MDHLSQHGRGLHQPGDSPGPVAAAPLPHAHPEYSGFHQHAGKFGALAAYGTDAPAIRDLVAGDPRLGERLHPDLPYCGAEVIWATRHEMASTVEDVLARRTRALFLNSRAALAMASQVAALMAAELGRQAAWQAAQVRSFETLARGYLLEK